MEIAQAALLAASGLAREQQGGGVHHCGGGTDGRKRDPGYHLIAGGRRAFEAAVGFRAPIRNWLRRFNVTIGIGGYVGSVIMVAAILLSLPLFALAVRGVGDWWLALLALLGLIPAIHAAMALGNPSVTREGGATNPPGPELRHGVPSPPRTKVAAPIP